MANANGAFGLRPYGMLGSAPASIGTTEYRIASNNSNPIFQGMPVIPLAAGVIDDLQAAAGGTVSIVGVFNGCEYVSSTTGETVFSNFWPGSGADTNFDIVGFVYDNPFQRFAIATDATFTNRATALAAIFENTQLNGGTGGSSTTGVSSASMDVATLDATNASLPLKIVGLSQDVENEDYTAAGATVIVMFNNHALLENDVETAVS